MIRFAAGEVQPGGLQAAKSAPEFADSDPPTMGGVRVTHLQGDNSEAAEQLLIAKAGVRFAGVSLSYLNDRLTHDRSGERRGRHSKRRHGTQRQRQHAAQLL